MSKRPRYSAKVVKGGFAISDPLTAQRLRLKGYSIGDDVALEVFKARNPKFNGLAHKFGELLAQNLDDFAGMDSHDVLKRIQLEAGIACDEVQLRGDFGLVYHRQARSLSFDQMDEGEFHNVYEAMCRHVSAKYWPAMKPEEIEKMAAFMPDAA